jgi:hypothetical protein
VLKELAHPSQARPGETLPIAMKWQNSGSVPCYRPYRLAYRLQNAERGGSVVVSPITVNRWMPSTANVLSKSVLKNVPDLPPGDVADVSDNVRLPPDMSPGNYALAVAVVGEDKVPVVRLAIEGRSSDGWYVLSQLTVKQ